jgi:hypothetical protein
MKEQPKKPVPKRQKITIFYLGSLRHHFLSGFASAG